MEGTTDKLNAISLFSGAGGLDCGIEMSKQVNIILANDIRRAPAETNSKNFKREIQKVDSISIDKNKSIFVLGDVRDIQFDKLKLPPVDLIAGGPPCQDFSIVRGPSNERQGINVERGKLYMQFVRALYDIQPSFFIFENVPGLKSANKGLAYKTIIEDFSNLNQRWEDIEKIAGNGAKPDIKGYELVFSGIVDSTRFGVPQRRRRLVILGIRKGYADRYKIEYISKKAEEKLGSKSLLLKYPLSPIEAFEGKTLDKLQDRYSTIMHEYDDIIDFAKTGGSLSWKEMIWDNMKFDIKEDYKLINGIKDFDDSEFQIALKEHERILKLLGYFGRSLEQTEFEDGSNKAPFDSASVASRLKMIPPGMNYEFLECNGLKGHGMSLIYRRIHPLKPSNTIVAFGGGGTWGYHYRRGRGKLTNRERARLQSFPDSFKFTGSSSEVRAQIGEAVPPLLGLSLADLFLELNRLG